MSDHTEHGRSRDEDSGSESLSDVVRRRLEDLPKGVPEEERDVEEEQRWAQLNEILNALCLVMAAAGNPGLTTLDWGYANPPWGGLPGNWVPELHFGWVLTTVARANPSSSSSVKAGELRGHTAMWKCRLRRSGISVPAACTESAATSGRDFLLAAPNGPTCRMRSRMVLRS